MEWLKNALNGVRDLRTMGTKFAAHLPNVSKWDCRETGSCIFCGRGSWDRLCLWDTLAVEGLLQTGVSSHDPATRGDLFKSPKSTYPWPSTGETSSSTLLRLPSGRVTLVSWETWASDEGLVSSRHPRLQMAVGLEVAWVFLRLLHEALFSCWSGCPFP